MTNWSHSGKARPVFKGLHSLIMGWIVLFVTILAQAASDRPPVVVVSLDGFRYDYIDHIYSPNMDRLIGEGFRAKMISSRPSLTFPNHYTLVTGFEPYKHGIISNKMYDSQLDQWFSKDQGSSIDDPIWYQKQPIWVTVKEAGLQSAVFFWFSSEVEGRTPNWFTPFDKSMPYEARFEKLASWLSQDKEPTPDIMFFYFSLLDGVGHDSGPHSPELLQAMSTADWLIGQFLDIIADSNRKVNFLVVSDHGMTALKETWTPISTIKTALGNDLKEFVNSYSQLDLFLTNPNEETVAKALNRLPKKPFIEWYAREQFPYGAHPSRNGDIIGVMAPGHEFRESARGRVKGAHGYAPEHPHMAANILGEGPAFNVGQTLDKVRSVDVYPLLLHLLGLPAEPVDGTLDVWTPVLVDKTSSAGGE